jgi:hypothetical protein
MATSRNSGGSEGGASRIDNVETLMQCTSPPTAVPVSDQSGACAHEAHWPKTRKAFVRLSLAVNIVVLIPVCTVLIAFSSSEPVDYAWGQPTSGRGILLSIYFAFLIVSILLLAMHSRNSDNAAIHHMVAALLATQIMKKVTTPATVGAENPVAISNLCISALHVVTLYLLWKGRQQNEVQVSEQSDAGAPEAHWPKTSMAFVRLSLAVNIVVLIAVCTVLIAFSSSEPVVYGWGPRTSGRGILLSIYFAILVVSILLLAMHSRYPNNSAIHHMVAVLLTTQIIYKVSTPATAGAANPVAISNLCISALHAVTLYFLWKGQNSATEHGNLEQQSIPH